MSVDAEGPLLAIAEISVTLAGFSSVVIALRGGGPEAWSTEDRWGLANVLAASVATLVGALLPFPLAHLGWSSDLVWGIANGVVGALVLAAVAVLAASVRRGTKPRTPRIFWSFVSSGFVVAGMLLLAAFGVGVPRGPSPLLAGLIWGLVAAFAQLAAFVLVSFSGRR